MKKIIIPILCLFFLGYSFAGTPTQTALSSSVTGSLAAAGKDTITVSNVLLDADSVGLMINFNRDSVSGVIYYRYMTPQGNSDKSFAEADQLSTFDCNDGSYAVFTNAIPRVAGSFYADIYIILTNDDVSSSPRTITTNIYSIKWR